MSETTIGGPSRYSPTHWSSETTSSEGAQRTSSREGRPSDFFSDGPSSPGVLKLLEAYRPPTKNQCAVHNELPANGSSQEILRSPDDGLIEPKHGTTKEEDSPLSTVATWVNEHPRVMGCLKAVGGAAETVVGGAAILAPEPTALTKVVGVAALTHGIDTLQSGIHQVLAGTPKQTLTSEGIELAAEAVGVDPQSAAVGAELADAALGVGLSLGAGALSSTANAAAVTQGQRALATAPQDGSALDALRSWWLRGAEGDQAWRASSAADKFFYELGQKTLTDANWERFGHIADPVERGRAMWDAQGAMRATLNEGRGVVWGAGKTLDTGPTPGLRLMAQEGAAVVGAGGSSSKAVTTMCRIADEQ